MWRVDRFRACARRELVFLALGTMEVCVTTPLLAAFLSRIVPVRPLPVTGIFLGVVLAVHYLVRAGLRLQLHPSLRSGLLGLGMLASGLLVVHRYLHAEMPLWDPAWLGNVFWNLQHEELSQDVVLFLLVLFLWWRGTVLAQRRLESRAVVLHFRVGVVMLAITTIVGGFILPWPPHQFVFVFFFVSLVGIALARAEEVGQQYGGSQSPFDFRWLAMVVAVGLVVLLLAAGVATLLTGENVSRLIAPALALEQFVVGILVYVISWVAYGVSHLFLAVFGEFDWEQFGRLLVQNPPAVPTQSQASSFTVEQLARARATGIVIGVLLALVLVALSLRRLRARAGRRRREARESVWEEVDLRLGLRDLWRQGRRRLDAAAAALSRVSLNRFLAALTIRRIYAHLAALAAERGYPRALHETPYEYMPALAQAFPDSRDEVARITDAYIAVHYGEVPERSEEVAVVRAAWQRIRRCYVI
jgi:hypothetical protein